MSIQIFDTIKKEIGKNLKYYNVTDGWLTSKDVTETDIAAIINTLYREELFQLLVTQYPFYYREIATADSWIATGTVSASSTSTTLVASSAIFNNSMVGLTVWNDTDEESAKITAYTSTTQVTLDTTIGDTWDGDTIYVLGQEFAFGGDATDMYTLESVGLKYNSTDSYFYRPGSPRPKFDFLQQGGEIADSANAIWYLTTVDVSGVPTNAIGIFPGFTNKITKALEITYTARPPELSGSSDLPRLPTSQPLIYGGTMRAFQQRNMWQEASYFERLYEKSKVEMISRFTPTSTAGAQKKYIPRRFGSMFRRTI